MYTLFGYICSVSSLCLLWFLKVSKWWHKSFNKNEILMTNFKYSNIHCDICLKIRYHHLIGFFISKYLNEFTSLIFLKFVLIDANIYHFLKIIVITFVIFTVFWLNASTYLNCIAVPFRFYQILLDRLWRHL